MLKWPFSTGRFTRHTRRTLDALTTMNDLERFDLHADSNALRNLAIESP